MTIKYADDINLLTKQLTSPFTDEIFKARAIFRWITENIAYDFKYYNRYYYRDREPKGFSCSGDSLVAKSRKMYGKPVILQKHLIRKRLFARATHCFLKRCAT